MIKIKFYYPTLYLFRIKSKNEEVQRKYPNFYIKIGDTHREIAIRIKEWEKVLREFNNDNTLTIELIYTRVLVKDTSKDISEENICARDYLIHNLLCYGSIIEEKYDRLSKDEFGSNEFFKVSENYTTEKIISDIDKVVDYIFDHPNEFILNKTCSVISTTQLPEYERVNNFLPRFYQEEMVKKAVKALITDNCERFLNWCSPRTGKTYACLLLVKELGKYSSESLFNVVLTGKPSVNEEWRKNAQENVQFSNIVYAERIPGQINTFRYWNDSTKPSVTRNGIEELYELCKNEKKHVMLFLSLQDITGSDTSNIDFDEDIVMSINPKERYKVFFELDNYNKKKVNIDYVIVDEAHYAALNPKNKAGKFLDELIKFQNAKRIDNSATPYRAAFNGIYDIHSSNVYYFNLKEFFNRDFNSLTAEEKVYYTLLKEKFPEKYTICPLNSAIFEKTLTF